MATGQLGGLEITVLANIANLVSDLGKAQDANAKAAKQFQKDWEESVSAVHEAFGGLAEIAGIGLGVAALAEVAKQSLDTAEKVQNMSAAFGFSTQAIQTMSYAATLVGGNVDSAGAAMVRLSRSAEQAASGNVQAAEAFRAIGISAQQLGDLLKDPDSLLKTVAQHVDEYGASTAKTAALQQIFGRGVADLIPTLKELGSNYDELRARAENLGIVLSSQDQSGLAQAKESMNDLKEVATGLGNQFTIALLPAITGVVEYFDELGSDQSVRNFFRDLGTDVSQFVVVFGQIKGMLGDAIGQFGALADAVGIDTNGMRGDFVSFVKEFQDAGAELKNNISQTWIDIKIAFEQMIIAMEGDIADFLDKMARATDKFSGAGWVSNMLGGPSAQKSMAEFTAGLRDVDAGLEGYAAEMAAAGKARDESLASNQAWADSVRLTASALGVMTTGLDEFQASLVNGDVAGNLAKLAEAEQNIHATAAEMIKDGADAAKVNADADNAIKTLTASVKDADAAQVNYNANAKAGIDTQKALAEELTKWSEQMDALAAKTAGPWEQAALQYQAAVNKQNDELVQMIGNGLSLADALTLLDQAIDLDTAAMYKSIAADLEKNDAADTWIQKLKDQVSQLGLLTNAEKASAEFEALATKNLLDNRDALGESFSMMQEAIDSNAKIKQGYVDSATALKDWGDQLKLNQEVMNDWAGIAANAFDSAFTAINKDIVEGGDVMKDLVNVAKQVVEAILLQFEKLAIINPLLNSIFGNTGGGLLPTLSNSNLGSLFGGDASSAGGLGDDFSFGSAGSGDFADAGGGGLSLGGFSGLGLLAGAGAGFSEFNQAGGGAAGLAGGAAYGVGAYALSGALTAGVGAAAAGGISAGLAAGFAAIPVVGWIGLAAMGLNMITGGGLFGTAAKPTGSEESVNVGPGGASISAALDEKGKKAFFGGSYYKTVNEPVSQSDTDAINGFFTSLQSSIQKGADQLAEAAPDIIGGSFKETFDKAGNMKTQISTILGKSYSETLADFENRVTADNLLQLLPASQNATAIADAWQSSATTLLDGSEMLVQAQIDIKNGMSLLGASDSSLADVASVVESLAQSGETMVQTYGRLQAETENATADFNALGETTGRTGADFVTLADQMTQAAGGVDNLNKLMQQFSTAFVSVQDQQSNALSALQKTASGDLTGIGEDPTESMAKFYADYLAALPTLTGAQIVQWQEAGVALSAVNDALATIAGNKQAYADYEVQTQGDAFVQSLVKVVEAEKAAVDNANKLAQAAGLAGASQADLAAITEQGAMQMKAALASLSSGIASDLASLNGASNQADGGYDGMFEIAESKAANQAAAAASAANQQALALDIIQKAGDFSYASGQSIADTIKSQNVPIEQLAKILGETPDQINKQIAAQVKSDASLTTMASQGAAQVTLLAAILATLGGKSPIDLSGLGAPTPSTRFGAAAGVGAGALSGRGLGSAQTSSPDVVAAILQTHAEKMASDKQVIASNNMLRAAIYNRNGRAQTA